MEEENGRDGGEKVMVNPLQHDWIPSTLGHGRSMCRRCFVTDMEAAVLGVMNACDVPPKVPASANDNRNDDLPDDDNEYDAEDEFEFDCHLDPESGQCGAAGSEECDFECPYRDSEFFAGSAAWRRKHGEK